MARATGAVRRPMSPCWALKWRSVPTTFSSSRTISASLNAARPVSVAARAAFVRRPSSVIISRAAEEIARIRLISKFAKLLIDCVGDPGFQTQNCINLPAGHLITISIPSLKMDLFFATPPLFIAAYYGRLSDVNALLAAGANKEAAMTDGATPLLVAALNGHLPVVNALLAAGANKNSAMTSGATPLYIAAQNGHLHVVTALLEAGANKEAALTSGVTPLHVAAQNGHLPVVNALLAAGANKDATTTNGATPLYVAAQVGHLPVVNALLAAGANKDAALTNGATPLYVAAQEGHLPVVNALLAAGANIHSIFNGKPIISYAKEGKFTPAIKKAILDAAPITKWTPLTQSSISLFDAIFNTSVPTDPTTGLPTGAKSAAINTSTCPVCFEYINRSEACNYMKHNCSASGNYYHQELYNKFKNPAGEIAWCTICGRICVGHRHYSLSDPSAPVPAFAPVTTTNPFADDCKQEGGGGLEEKLKRFRRAREVLKELESETTLPYDDAMNILIEEMWRAPLAKLPLKSKLNAMMIAKAFTNYPTSTFPPNVRPTNSKTITKVIDPLPVELLPELVEMPATNAISMNDITTIIHFKHSSIHSAETNTSNTDVSRIGVASFFSWLDQQMITAKLGSCWNSECTAYLHPDEVSEVIHQLEKKGTDVKVYLPIAERYARLYVQKFGRVPTAPLGGGAAGGAGAAERRRKQRRRTRRGAWRKSRHNSSVDL